MATLLPVSDITHVSSGVARVRSPDALSVTNFIQVVSFYFIAENFAIKERKEYFFEIVVSRASRHLCPRSDYITARFLTIRDLIRRIF